MIQKRLLIAIALLLLVTVTGCSTMPPDTVTKNFLSALQTSDFERAATYVVDSNPLALKKNLPGKDEKSEQIGKSLLSKATYEVGAVKKTGDQATVSVKVTAIDVVRVATKAMSELMPMAFAAAFSKDKSKQDMDAMMNQYLENSISDPQAPKVTTDVNVNLVKTKDGWKIGSNNDELFNAITGNAAKAFGNK